MKCKSCGKNLKRLKWNKTTDMMVCLKDGCRANRQPQGSCGASRGATRGEELLYWKQTPAGIDSQAFMDTITETPRYFGGTWKRRQHIHQRLKPLTWLPEVAIASDRRAMFRDPWFTGVPNRKGGR